MNAFKEPGKINTWSTLDLVNDKFFFLHKGCALMNYILLYFNCILI